MAEYYRGHVYAAREGEDGDGIPQDEPLELVNILNSPAVVRINEWKDVGLELGVEEHVLDRIDIDCRGRTNDCKREMFSYWLEDDLQASWEKVSGAVKRARKRVEAATAREESRRNIEEEENKAVSAIDQLQKSLDEMDTTNTKIAENQTRLVEEVKEQERKWESYRAQWRREDMEWNEGEQRRKQIKEALEAHDLQRSQFVKRFLREKQLPDNLSSQEIECYL